MLRQNLRISGQENGKSSKQRIKRKNLVILAVAFLQRTGHPFLKRLGINFPSEVPKWRLAAECRDTQRPNLSKL